MKIIDRIREALTPPSFNHMCIRCDERKPDVPYAGAYCEACEEIVRYIARTHPDVYAAYVERHNAVGHRVPMIGERA